MAVVRESLILVPVTVPGELLQVGRTEQVEHPSAQHELLIKPDLRSARPGAASGTSPCDLLRGSHSESLRFSHVEHQFVEFLIDQSYSPRLAGTT